MEVNYAIIALTILAVVVLIVWLIRRNQRDQKNLERKIKTSEMKPNKHKRDQV